MLRGTGEYRLERWLVGGVAAVTLRRSDASSPLPAVVVYHGLGEDRTENLLRLAVPLADEGRLAVLPDAAGHGERRGIGFGERLTTDRDNLFLETLDGTVGEARELFRWVASRDDVDGSRIGAVGLSMGGAVVLRLACGGLQSPPRAAVVLMPALPGPASPVRQRAAYGEPDPGLCYPTPLLVVHGTEEGAAARYPTSRDFYGALVPHYADDPGRLRFVDVAGAWEAVGEAFWVEEALAWLRRYL